MSAEVPSVIDESCYTGEARRRYVNPKLYIVNIIANYDSEFNGNASPTWREYVAYALECFWKQRNSFNVDRLADRYCNFINGKSAVQDWQEDLRNYFGVANFPQQIARPQKNEILSLMSADGYADWLSYQQQKANENGK